MTLLPELIRDLYDLIDGLVADGVDSQVPLITPCFFKDFLKFGGL